MPVIERPSLLPLVKLPPTEWQLIPTASPLHLGVSVYARVVDGHLTRHFQRWSIFDFPNDLFGIEDLEKAGLLDVYVAAIGQLPDGAAPEPSNVAPIVAEGSDVRPENHGVAAAICALRRATLDFFHAILSVRLRKVGS